MFSTSTIELSKNALVNNLRFIRGKLKKGTRLCCVVKGNAYGHGFCEYANMAMDCGVNYFGVHSAEEAYQLVNGLEQIPDTFIMGDIHNEAVEWAIENGIEFSVYDMHRLEQAIGFAEKLKKKAKIHIEIETGMRRTGFETDSFSQLAEYLKDNENNLVFQGIFTHFAGAESLANNFRVSKQLFNFQNARYFFESKGLSPLYHHAACSAVLLNYPEAIGNMVRVGILQYGFWPNNETLIRYCGEKKTTDPLRRVIKWKSRVMATKNVKKGWFVGYGTTYLAHHNMKIAIIPVGYAHGYARNLSNIGGVLINGKIAPVVGIVNMNSMTVDITHIPDVQKGEEVVLIGKQKTKEITVNSFSEQSNQLNYELLTRLPYSIPRIVCN
jgi:alanine racemase